VAVLVDEAVWPWRGARWAHLVSDESVAELHAFARRLGLRRMAFQGDHYDVPTDVRERALALGAEAVRGRDLVRRLRAAGLRLAAADRPGSWEEVGRWSAPGSRPDFGPMDPVVPDNLAEAFQGVDAPWTSADVVAFHRLVSQRWAEVALVVEDDEGVVLAGDVPAGVEVRCHDDRMVELLTPRRREAR
jgi:hypothetical protein